MILLAVRNISLKFGGFTAVDDVSFDLEEDAVCSIIGPNGAGKTSLFNVITGVYEPSSGELRYRGKRMDPEFSIFTGLAFAGIAALTGLGLQIVVHVQSLWEASISANYVFREPFPWMKGLRDGAALLVSRSSWPLIIGAVLGALGSWSVWRRGRHTPERMACLGLSRTFQNIRLFRDMTALDNVLVGMDRHSKVRLWDAAFPFGRNRSEEAKHREKALELLDFVGLKKHAGARAGNLPYGHQRRLEIARALATDPELLLLDEPAAGTNPTEARSLMELIRAIRQRGITILLIEHHMKVVMGVSDSVVVLDHGEKIAEGTPEAVQRDEKVIEAYLGKNDDGL